MSTCVHFSTFHWAFDLQLSVFLRCSRLWSSCRPGRQVNKQLCCLLHSIYIMSRGIGVYSIPKGMNCMIKAVRQVVSPTRDRHTVDRVTRTTHCRVCNWRCTVHRKPMQLATSERDTTQRVKLLLKSQELLLKAQTCHQQQ